MPTPRPSQTQRAPYASAGGGRGQRLRQIIQQALTRRQVLDFKNVSRMPHAVVAPSRRRLEEWMRVNQVPSDATVRAFPGFADVMLVMPHTAEGKNLLEELRHLMAP